MLLHIQHSNFGINSLLDTPDNIEKIGKLIEDDPYLTYVELEAASQLCRATLHTIIHDHPKLRKTTSRWVPHDLTQKNKEARIRICQENLNKFESGKWDLYDVLTDSSKTIKQKLDKASSIS